MNKELENMIEVAEDLGWRLYRNGDEFDFEKYSPEGQDFHFIMTTTTLREAIDDISERCDNFDCSEETYLWLDSTGHGKNGAPYDMKDLYEDMESCLNMLKELRDAWVLLLTDETVTN